MDCIECGAKSNYHRAVVELVTGAVLGSYCVDCEQRRFGDAPERREARSTENDRSCAVTTRATTSTARRTIRSDSTAPRRL